MTRQNQQTEEDKENQPSLTKRIPLRSREKASDCYHRLPLVPANVVMDQLDVYYRVQAQVEVEIPEAEARQIKIEQKRQELAQKEEERKKKAEEEKLAGKKKGFLSKMLTAAKK